ncbi:hypothetical protein BOTBODRAFT_186794 [Botryobasidium botryosum FD-172 SS1]|uniref:Uncharacterized protein n=1 Tax=Botryobasidium botryosum (strain FD-172 SS1) TaxID=930990 RepID=A0A067MN08_BOTB1|nr:hypothetical protein BOTBODRAFT_186794 [Botryobasidium botryosum FD-172 SS1]
MASAPLDHYKVDRASVDVEALAQRQARYLKIHAEEAQILAADPTARDRAIAEMNSSPMVKPGGLGASLLVPFGEDPNPYLDGLDAVLDKAAVTTEERVKRLNCAICGLLVFSEYKVRFALLDYPDLKKKVQLRTQQIFDEWVAGDFAQKFGIQTSPSQPRASPSPPPRPPAASLKHIDATSIDHLLKNPNFIFDMKFLLPDKPDDGSAWELESFSHSKSGVQFNILFEGCDDPIPHDAQEMRALLEDNHTFA